MTEPMTTSMKMFVNDFRQVRKKYIAIANQGRDPLCIFQECFEEDGSLRNSLYAKIAYIFGTTHQQKGHHLRLLSFKDGLNEILSNESMRNIYNNTANAEDEKNLLPNIPPIPVDVHFDLNKWSQVFQSIVDGPQEEKEDLFDQTFYGWIANNVGSMISNLFYGPPPPVAKFDCPFCSAKFFTNSEKWTHINAKLGPYNLDLSRILLYNRDVILRKDFLLYLQKRYGADRFVIYSKWIRQQKETLQRIAIRDFLVQEWKKMNRRYCRLHE